MRVANDIAYVRDLMNGNTLATLEVGTRVWIYRDFRRKISDEYMRVIAKGEWEGHCIHEDYLEVVFVPINP